jgi:hypothetical protein
MVRGARAVLVDMPRYRTAFACLTVAASLAVAAAPAGAASGKHCGNIPKPGPICHPPALP